MSDREVEVTTRRVTTVDTFQDALVFIMENMDEVGPAPHVEISPLEISGTFTLGELLGVSVVNDGESTEERTVFEVSITNMITKERANGTI
jgi:hypothetical protein